MNNKIELEDLKSADLLNSTGRNPPKSGFAKASPRSHRSENEGGLNTEDVQRKRVAQVVLGLPVDGPFDYFLESSLREKASIGQRVWVSFGRNNRIGYIVGLSATSKYKKLKPISSLLDTIPVLDAGLLNLTRDFAKYYACSWGEAIEAAMPLVLRKGKLANLGGEQITPRTRGLSDQEPESILLHDPGNSKRWPFIIDRIKKTLDRQLGVIFLVPESLLIASVHKKIIEAGFEKTVILDKRLKPKEDLANWILSKTGRARLVVGTRSAVFSPVKDLGLIIVYEEDHPAYKQEQSPFYHAREVAILRSQIEKCDVVFVSSAPSAGIWHSSERKKFKRIFFEPDKPSDMQLIDLLNYNPKKTPFISIPLRNQIQKTLESKGKVLLYMNRRGFSTITRCNQCAFTLKCERCEINLTYLYSKKKLVCRHCNYAAELPQVCPQCKSSYLRSLGMGVEKLESEVSRIFPQARVERFDKETKTCPVQFDILIATQAVMKLEGQVPINLIGVLGIDSELNRLDFRSGQRVFSLLIHLRQWASEKIMVQSRLIDNYSLQAAAKMDFKKFYRHELQIRKEMDFPPYWHLVSIGLRGAAEKLAFEAANSFYAALKETHHKSIEVIEPHPDVIPKMRDKYRFTILLKGKKVPSMLAAVKKVFKTFKKKNVIISIDVDPL